jgi:hypothetical protein
MAADPTPGIIQAAQGGFAAQDAELADIRNRQLRTVLRQTANGSGNIDATFGLDRKFRLIYVRAHFAGGAGTAPLNLSLDSGMGAANDAKLFTVTQAGTGKDVNLRVQGADLVDPSPWTFQADDRIRIQWTNPDAANMTWGLEVGLALAS